MPPDRVALVTGASRGVGKGIVLALAGLGWTVYLTGRSTRAGGRTVELPGTIEETAEAAGATPISCDHRDDAQTRAAVDRVRGEQGRLDLLVNNAWAGYEYMHRHEWDFVGARSWNRPLSIWDDMLGSVRMQYATTVFAAPLLIETGGSLVVNISEPSAVESNGDTAYGVAKAATDRLTSELARELADDGVAVVSLHPGLVRTEAVLAVGEYFDLTTSHSPELVGRVIDAVYEHGAGERTGLAFAVRDLQAEYGIAD